MAGSYDHVTHDDGSFRRDPDDFSNMIENIGDAFEACEQMHWMINYLTAGNRVQINHSVAAYYKHCREQRRKP